MITVLLTNGTKVVFPTAKLQCQKDGLTHICADMHGEAWLGSVLPCGAVTLGTQDVMIITPKPAEQVFKKKEGK